MAASAEEEVTMSLHDVDEGARGALADVRAILQHVFDDEVEAAPTDKINNTIIRVFPPYFVVPGAICL